MLFWQHLIIIWNACAVEFGLLVIIHARAAPSVEEQLGQNTLSQAMFIMPLELKMGDFQLPKIM